MEVADNSKQYSLRWEKHALNLAAEAGYFFEDESFLDCTLSAEGQCIDAHKIILSASSSYLSSLLKITSDKHPILIFNDLKFEQLKSLVAFIYNGSVNISENNIHAFLNAAQSLLIKGLSEEEPQDGTKSSDWIKRTSKNVEIEDSRIDFRKSMSRPPTIRKLESYDDPTKPVKKQKTVLPKMDGSSYVECEESLSKLQEISFTKYINRNLNCKQMGKNDPVENKWNNCDEKGKISENYVVKSWKHNSIEDLNGRHKQQNKNNNFKKFKLDKSFVPRTEELNQSEKHKVLEKCDTVVSGIVTDKGKPEEEENRVKKEPEMEQIILVEPKQEIMEEEDTNSEHFDDGQTTGNETLTSDSENAYDGKTMPPYYQHPIVDRGVPVPLLMCKTSLSEPETVEPGWIPTITSAMPSDHPSHLSAMDPAQLDLQCRTCTQDLPCPTCTKKYKSRYALNRHILYECGKARKSFSCDECGKKVTRQDTLQKHKLIHLVQHLKEKESETESSESAKLKKK